nr:hypothetical protein [Tanacetum cinerariifolium]
LNGKPYSKSYITHQDLLQGGKLVLEMGAKPSATWGVAPQDRPKTIQLLVLLLLLCQGYAYAQASKVSGKITSATNEPLIGVSILAALPSTSLWLSTARRLGK